MLCVSFQSLWLSNKKGNCFPFATDARNWPRKTTEKGETCGFLNITERAWKRKAFKMMWNRQRKNGRKVAGRKAVA